MHNEEKAIQEIKALSVNARHHLSHVLRNGLCTILSAALLKEDVEREVIAVEKRIKEMGL